MNKLGKMIGKIMAILLAMSLLAGCAAGGFTLGNTLDTNSYSTACHATGDPANPYEEITITNDIFPVPVNGCPTGPVAISDGKIAICHATGDETNPYNKLTVSVNGLDGHGAHADDVFPTRDGNCPKSPAAGGKRGICHATGDLANPYEKIMVNNAEFTEHLGHPNDINPVPVNGCPTSPVTIGDGKITICHATGSKTNPYNQITISVNGLNGHGKHKDDIIPAPESGCPTNPAPVNNDGKITICHATGSKTNRYVEITISVNGLNGHGKHKDDIIPAPAAGCPK